MTNLTPQELSLAAKLLDDMSDHYANHGCNDFDFPADWTKEQRAVFVKEFHDFNGDPEEYNPKFLRLEDFAAMGFLAHKLRSLSPVVTPGPSR